MKRLNPETQKPFKRHDTRGKDNKLFFAYTNVVKRDGFFKEIWLSPESMEKQTQGNKAIKRKAYVRKSDRLPPNAGRYFKAHPRAERDYHKLVKMLRQEPTITREDLLEMLDSEDHMVLDFISTHITIPS